MSVLKMLWEGISGIFIDLMCFTGIMNYSYDAAAGHNSKLLADRPPKTAAYPSVWDGCVGVGRYARPITHCDAASQWGSRRGQRVSCSFPIWR